MVSKKSRLRLTVSEHAPFVTLMSSSAMSLLYEEPTVPRKMRLPDPWPRSGICCRTHWSVLDGPGVSTNKTQHSHHPLPHQFTRDCLIFFSREKKKNNHDSNRTQERMSLSGIFCLRFCFVLSSTHPPEPFRPFVNMFFHCGETTSKG